MGCGQRVRLLRRLGRFQELLYRGRVLAVSFLLQALRFDSAFRTTCIEHAARLGIALEVVQRDPRSRGFAPLPRRWTIERTFGWIMMFRRLARDYETLPTRSAALIQLRMIDLMARRLTGESTPTWRGA